MGFITFIQYFPYEQARIHSVQLELPVELVSGLRKELHRLRAVSLGRGSWEDNKEGFVFADRYGRQMDVLFFDGMAYFGRFTEPKH